MFARQLEVVARISCRGISSEAIVLLPDEALRDVECEPILEVILRCASSRLGKKCPLGVSPEGMTADCATSVGVEDPSSKAGTLVKESLASWLPVDEDIVKQRGSWSFCGKGGCDES